MIRDRGRKKKDRSMKEGEEYEEGDEKKESMSKMI